MKTFGTAWARERTGRLMASGLVHVFSVNVLLQLLGFGSVLMVAKFIAAEELAIIKTAQAYAAVLVILAGAGLTAPILYYCADPRIAGDEKVAMLRTAARLTVLVGGLVLIVALAAVAGLVGVATQTGTAYALYALALPGLALTSLVFVYLQSRQQFAALARNQAWIKTVSIAVVIGATYLWGVRGFLFATVTTVYLGLIPLLRQALPAGPRRVVKLPPDFRVRAGYAMSGTFITMLGQSSDFMIMDFTNVPAADVGRYALASVFLLAASTLTGSIQTVVTPQFTAMTVRPAEFRRLLAAWSKRMPAISIVVGLLGVGVASLLERYFFGAAYAGFTVYLAILMIKYVAWSNFAILGAAMAGAGVVRSGVAVAALMTLLCFSIGVPMCREFGAAGAAWTQVIVALVSLLVIWMVQRFEFRRLFDSIPPTT